MPIILEVELHSARTGRTGLSYQFTPKHHGGQADAAQWLPPLTRADEFGVFDLADAHAIADEAGNMYGVLRDAGGDLLPLGTWGQQLAEFPAARPGEVWHGYPLYPLGGEFPPHLAGDRCKPPKAVFARLEASGAIDKRARKRLAKGDFA